MADSTGKVDCPSCGLPQLVINFDEKTCFCSNCKLSISLTTYLKHRFGFDFKYRGVSYSYTLARQYEGTSKSSLEFLSDRGFVSLLTVDVDHDLTIFEELRADWPGMELAVHPRCLPKTATCPLCESRDFTFTEGVARCSSCKRYSMLTPSYVFAKLLEKTTYTGELAFIDHLTISKVRNSRLFSVKALESKNQVLAKLHLRVSEAENSGDPEYVLAVEKVGMPEDQFILFLAQMVMDLDDKRVEVKPVNKVF